VKRNTKSNASEIYEPDIAGVTTPSAITIEVPKRTSIKSSFFSIDEVSRRSLILKDLSSSTDGTLSWKLVMRVSEGSWFGSKLAFAFLHIREYKAKIPPAKYTENSLLDIKLQGNNVF
jgi:hypothetical protein